MSTSAPDVLIFEPKTGEHHLPWLRLFSEDLLAGGMCLTLVPNDRADRRKREADPLGGTVVEFLSSAL